jgi:hypothetical protein
MFGFRRTIQTKGPDRFAINLGEEERSVLRAVCEDVVAALDDDANPLLRRVFPVGHASDPEIEAQYRALVHSDLLRTRREILTRVGETAFDTELDRVTLDKWMIGINTIRLVLGTRLDVIENHMPEIDHDDPDLPAWALYEFLGWLLEIVIQALSDSAPTTGR